MTSLCRRARLAPMIPLFCARPVYSRSLHRGRRTRTPAGNASTLRRVVASSSSQKQQQQQPPCLPCPAGLPHPPPRAAGRRVIVGRARLFGFPPPRIHVPPPCPRACCRHACTDPPLAARQHAAHQHSYLHARGGLGVVPAAPPTLRACHVYCRFLFLLPPRRDGTHHRPHVEGRPWQLWAPRRLHHYVAAALQRTRFCRCPLPALFPACHPLPSYRRSTYSDAPCSCQLSCVFYWTHTPTGCAEVPCCLRGCTLCRRPTWYIHHVVSG